MSLVGPERCRSFKTPGSRSAPGAPVRRPAPRIGLGSSSLLEPYQSIPQHFFPAAAPFTRLRESRRGKNAAPSAETVKASAREESGLVEDLLGPQQVIDRSTQLGRQDAERLGGAVLLRLPRLPTLGPRAGAQVQARRLAQGP